MKYCRYSIVCDSFRLELRPVDEGAGRLMVMQRRRVWRRGGRRRRRGWAGRGGGARRRPTADRAHLRRLLRVLRTAGRVQWVRLLRPPPSQRRPVRSTGQTAPYRPLPSCLSEVHLLHRTRRSKSVPIPKPRTFTLKIKKLN